MSRRIYYSRAAKEAESRKIRQEALLTMRKARRNLDPGLLVMAREAIATLLQRRRDEEAPDESAYNHQNAQDQHSCGQQAVPVDRKKNMSIVLKYLEMTSGDKELHQQISAYLSE